MGKIGRKTIKTPTFQDGAHRTKHMGGHLASTGLFTLGVAKIYLLPAGADQAHYVPCDSMGQLKFLQIYIPAPMSQPTVKFFLKRACQ